MDKRHIDTLIQNFVDKECGAGATEEDIRNAEDMLGVRLPESYRLFLRRIGWARFSFEELYGLGADVPPHLDLIKNTLAERNSMEPLIPQHLLPVMNDGSGNHYCLDTSTIVMGECPVVFWDHERGDKQKPNNTATSFERWLTDLLNQLPNS